MSTYCSVHGCGNNSTVPGITFHNFPRNEQKRADWIAALNQTYWTPKKSSRICSKHFKEEDIDRTSLCLVRIRQNAKPTLFPANPYYAPPAYRLAQMSGKPSRKIKGSPPSPPPEQPPQPYVEQPPATSHEQPSLEQPSHEQPSLEQPSLEQPSHEQPFPEQPSPEQPPQTSLEQPVQPSLEQPPQALQPLQASLEQPSPEVPPQPSSNQPLQPSSEQPPQLSVDQRPQPDEQPPQPSQKESQTVPCQVFLIPLEHPPQQFTKEPPTFHLLSPRLAEKRGFINPTTAKKLKTKLFKREQALKLERQRTFRLRKQLAKMTSLVDDLRQKLESKSDTAQCSVKRKVNKAQGTKQTKKSEE
ncbi:hypothetical protein M8J76_002549 [Diaphorina citri]|nr:hypothetical protein M8J76_002549 [Diaphorina citri]KAI5747133.1 hypothetical protein M8J77_011445 [Diaphorina citri]KAI5747495.1 hypothetical protein M8J77_015215 [Diaphorina citri]